MTDAELEKFRQQLLTLQSELQELEIESVEDGLPVELDQAKVGRLSRMDALQGQQMALETSRRRQQQLRQVTAAQRRLDAGDYGFCLECDEEINSRRLAVNPASAYCIRCAESRDT